MTLKKIKIKKENKKKINLQKPAYSTQQLLPIKDIYKGIVITKDDRYIKILEVAPIPFSMMTSSQKELVISAFSKVLKLGPDNMQFTEITLPTDLSPQMDYLHQAYIKEKSAECRQLQNEYKQKLLDSQQMSVSRRFFISFEYEKPIPIFQRPNFKRIVYELESIAQTISEGLEVCGNKVLNLSGSEDLNYVTAEILYTILNRRSNIPRFDDFFSRRLNEYYRYYGNRNFYIPPSDFISPDTLSFADKRYVVMNGMYYTYYYIPSNHYPDTVIASWLTPIINSIDGIDVNIYTKKIPSEQVLSSLRRNMVYSEVDMNTSDDSSQTMDVSSSTYLASSYLKDGLVAGDNFFYIGVLFTVFAETPELVDEKGKFLEKIAERMDMKVFRCYFDMRKAFYSSLPLARLDKSIYELTKRNCLSDGAASTYPFVSFELKDDNGILFGTNTYNNSMTIIDVFNTSRFTNPNMFFTGTSGAGKTYSLCLIALRMRELGQSVIIISPEKQHEFRRACKAIGGEFIEIAPGSSNRINIMEITQPDENAKKDMALIDGMDENVSLLSEKVASLITFFRFYIEDMTIQEQQLLDTAIIKTYQNFHITLDNRSLISIFNQNNHQAKMPILSDLQKTVEEIAKINPALKRIADILPYFTTGSGSSFNGQTNVNLNNPFTVIGLEKMKDNNLKLGMYMAMEYAWGKIREDRREHSFLIMDEWWKLAANKEAAEYSMNIARTIRAYGSGMIIATQDLEDILQFEGGIYGKAVLQNCYTKVLLKNTEDGARRIQSLLNLTNNEVERIQRYKNGKCLVLIGNLKLEMQFEASALEDELISTDSATLTRISKQKSNENLSQKSFSNNLKEENIK